jgi:hypothetical protein
MNINATYGQVAASLVLGASLSFLPMPSRRLIGWVTAALAMPTVAAALYGLTGALSFTLVQIALLRLSGLKIVVSEGKAVVAAFLVLVVIFYLLALGLGQFDPFGIGYRPVPLLTFMIPVGLLLAWRHEYVLLALVGFDLIAYGLGLFPNIWSALFDPLVVIVAGIRLALPNGNMMRGQARPVN